MTRDEWITRYAARINQRAGLSLEEARDVAVVGAETFEQDELAAGAVLAWEDPENAADEELSYWDNDEGGAS